MPKKAKAARPTKTRGPAKVSAATKAAQKSRKRSESRKARAGAHGRPANPVRAGLGKPLAAQLGAALLERAGGETPRAVESSAVAVQLIAFDRIEESRLNPRKARDPQKVAELAESIAQKGIQQPIKLRPHPKKPGRFEIVFGGSRRAAVELLVKAGRAPAGYKLPAMVETISDTELIELALVENIQRADMSPLEEGEAFVALRKAGGSTEKVAERLGKSQKWVQMRIALVERLAPKAKEALRAGEITLFQAQALYKGDPKHQVEVLARVKNGWTTSAEEITRQVTAGAPPVKIAHFPVKDYEAAGGELIEDEEGKDGPWFKDVALFAKLQREAIERTEAKLKEKWAWVRVMSHAAGEHFFSFEFNQSKNPKKAGAVIAIGHDGKVVVHTGLIAKAEERSPAEKKAAHKKALAKKNGGAQPPQITQPLMLYAKHEKTKALQNAIAFVADPELEGGDQPRAAMILTCIALMGDHEVFRIVRGEIRGEDAALSPLLRDAIDGFRAQLEGLVRAAPRGKDVAEGWGVLELKPDCADEAFRRMWQWQLATVQALFACLVAARCGTFNGYKPELGDDPLACAVAETLNIDMAKAWGADKANWTAYLALLKKSRAVRLVGHMPGLGLDAEELEKAKTGQVAQQIEVALELHPDQRAMVPPELTFGAGKAIEAAINKAPHKVVAGDGKGKRQTDLALEAAAVEESAGLGVISGTAARPKSRPRATEKGGGKKPTVTTHKLDGTVEVRELGAKPAAEPPEATA